MLVAGLLLGAVVLAFAGRPGLEAKHRRWQFFSVDPASRRPGRRRGARARKSPRVVPGGKAAAIAV